MAKNSFKNIKLNNNILTINGTDYILDGTATISDNNNSSFKGISCTDNGNGTCTLIVNGAQITVSGEEYTPVILPYLTFSSPYSFTLRVINSTKNWDGTLEYSTNTDSWSTWDGTSAISSTSTGDVKYLYLRGSNNTILTGTDSANTGAHRWVLSGSNISCEGNIENLLDYQTVIDGNHPTMASSFYRNMFYNCTSLTTAPELPATTLTEYCYGYMFYNCTSLITTPELPATTLASACYNNMFYNCTSLTTAPELPATTLQQYCYRNMFYNCTSLTTAPELPAKTLKTYCYAGMFDGCTSLTTAPELPAKTLQTYCYSQMFRGCTSLTTAPELPATTLQTQCYYFMFAGCTSLTTAPELPATTLKEQCYRNMFSNCTALITPAKIAGGTTQATSAKLCCYYMYSGCTNLNIYTSSSGHTAFYKAITYSTSSSSKYYDSSYRMFYNCYINGTKSTKEYLTAGTQYYY